MTLDQRQKLKAFERFQDFFYQLSKVPFSDWPMCQTEGCLNRESTEGSGKCFPHLNESDKIKNINKSHEKLENDFEQIVLMLKSARDTLEKMGVYGEVKRINTKLKEMEKLK